MLRCVELKGSPPSQPTCNPAHTFSKQGVSCAVEETDLPRCCSRRRPCDTWTLYVGGVACDSWPIIGKIPETRSSSPHVLLSVPDNCFQGKLGSVAHLVYVHRQSCSDATRRRRRPLCRPSDHATGSRLMIRRRPADDDVAC